MICLAQSFIGNYNAIRSIRVGFTLQDIDAFFPVPRLANVMGVYIVAKKQRLAVLGGLR